MKTEGGQAAEQMQKEILGKRTFQKKEILGKRMFQKKGNTWKIYLGKTTFPEKVMFRKKFVMLCDYCIKSNQILDPCKF